MEVSCVNDTQNRINTDFNKNIIPSQSNDGGPSNPPKVLERPLESRIAFVARRIGIKASIVATFVAIVATAAGLAVPGLGLVAFIGLISLPISLFVTSLLIEGVHAFSKEITAGKLEEYFKQGNEKKTCEILHNLFFYVKYGGSFDDIFSNFRDEADSILYNHKGIERIFICLEKSKSEKVKDSAAKLIYAALKQEQISPKTKISIINYLAQMAKDKRQNSTNEEQNNIKRSDIVTTYFGKKARNYLARLEDQYLEKVKSDSQYSIYDIVY